MKTVLLNESSFTTHFQRRQTTKSADSNRYLRTFLKEASAEIRIYFYRREWTSSVLLYLLTNEMTKKALLIDYSACALLSLVTTCCFPLLLPSSSVDEKKNSWISTERTKNDRRKISTKNIGKRKKKVADTELVAICTQMHCDNR